MATNDKILSYTEEALINTIDNVQLLTPVNQKFFKKCTLNAYYGLWSEEVPLHSLKYRYFGIGIGGRYPINDVGITSPYPSKKRDLNLYQPIPFRCRPLDEDLSPAEREEYRIRVMETVNGTKCVCYYLKKLTIIDNEVQIFKINPDTGVTEPYTLDPQNLSPIAEKPDTSGVQFSEDDNILVGVRLGMYVTAQEVYEYIDMKFNGDRRWAVLSEFGIYKGEDRPSTTNSITGTLDYTESIYTILAYKICTSGSAVLSDTWDMNQQFLVGPGQCLQFTNVKP